MELTNKEEKHRTAINFKLVTRPELYPAHALIKPTGNH